jgi:hypothetical protein
MLMLQSVATGVLEPFQILCAQSPSDNEPMERAPAGDGDSGHNPRLRKVNARTV